MGSASLPTYHRPIDEEPLGPEPLTGIVAEPAEQDGEGGPSGISRGPPEGADRGQGDSVSSDAGYRGTIRMVEGVVPDLEPTRQELQISARLLLHLSRQPRFASGETAPESLTQSGMATALGTSQASVSNSLNRLVDGGAVRVERSHVRRKFARLKVYQLTEHGHALVEQILKGMGT